MDIKLTPITDIFEYENNPRDNSFAIGKLVKSIKEFGFLQPLVCNLAGEIIVGHTRFLAAKRIGLAEVPVLFVDLDEKKQKAYRIVDNKVGSLATFDEMKLKIEMDNLLKDFDYDLLNYFDASELNKMEVAYNDAVRFLEDKDYNNSESFDTNQSGGTPVDIQNGDIYLLGDHIVACGDSTDLDFCKKLMKIKGVEAIDLVVTDPPYNVNFIEGKKTKDYLTQNDFVDIKNDNLSSDDFSAFISKCYVTLNSILKDGGGMYSFCSMSWIDVFLPAFKNAFYFKQVLIWNKAGHVFGFDDYKRKHEPCIYGWKKGAAHYFVNNKTLSDVLDFSRGSSKLHPTQKPIELISHLISNSSKIGEVVFDGFGGSGTTLIACEVLKRKCIIVDLEQSYCSTIISRWENEVGKKAEKWQDQKSR